MSKKLLKVGLIVSMLIGTIFMLAGCGNTSKKDKEETNKASEKINKVVGYSYIEETDDSLLNLNSDNSFQYYRDKDDLKDNYYEGTYKIYQGQEAVEYITNDLSSYGITKSELEDLFKRSSLYSEDNLYCVVLTNNKCIIDGKNVQEKPNDTPYYGFYSDVGNLLLVNMKSANLYNFVKQK